MLEYGTAAEISIVLAVITGILGYVFGKVGLSNIEADLATIKGLISGQQKVTVLPTPTVVATVPAANPTTPTTV
jgi:putative effector of murein hydrolase